MNETVAEAAARYAPGTDGARAVQRLNGTGSTEEHNATPLTVNAYATLISDTAIYMSFAAASALSTQVTATTALFWPANVPFEWVVKSGTKHVYVEAKDGSSPFDVAVWTSGGGMGAY